MPHPELTLEKRIRAELCGLDARLCVFADDLNGTTVELGADEVFESASTIKIFVLGCLFARAEAGMASLDEMLTLLRDILENRWCSKSVGRKDDQGRFRPDWYSFLPAEEAEKEIDQTVSALSLSPPGETEARYFFWDGSKDRTVPQPGQEQLNKKNRETLCRRVRKLIGRTGKDKTEVRQ